MSNVSAWEWNEAKKQFYLHQFDKDEPEFNFHNPDVQSYFKVSISDLEINQLNNDYEHLLQSFYLTSRPGVLAKT